MNTNLSENSSIETRDEGRPVTSERAAVPGKDTSPIAAGDGGNLNLRIMSEFEGQSTSGQPPKLMGLDDAAKRVKPWDFINRVVLDLLRGWAVKKGPDGSLQRWGLMDADGMTYGPVARQSAEAWISEQCDLAGYPKPLVTVTPFPDNYLRVVVFLGPVEIFDCVYAFTKASIS